MSLRIGILAILLLAIGSALSIYGIPRERDEGGGVGYVEVVAVIDGDTIEVIVDRSREQVRYIGIDTPESSRRAAERECFSEEATAANEALVGGARVQLVADEEDRDEYGRLLRYVYTEDTFVNMKLMEDGYARALTIPPNTRYAHVFEALEEKVSAAGTGLWSACE